MISSAKGSSSFVVCLLALVGCSPAGIHQNAASQQPATEVVAVTPTPDRRTTASPAPTVSDEIAEPPTPTPLTYRLQPGELLLAADNDAIPAIMADDSLFVSAEAGSQEWGDDDTVIGVEVAGHARAYPVRLLSLHEVVNDVVGGRPIAVTWCPLCFSAIVFDRDVGDRELTFGVSGYLLKNNLVMYDHQTNTLWSQVLAQSIRGPLRRTWLEPLPSELTTWGAWKEMYPETEILSAERLGRSADDIIDPYAGYYVSGAPGFGSAESDDRLMPKSLVIGLSREGISRAYPLEVLMQAGVIADQLGSQSILLVYNPAYQAVRAYQRQLGDQVLQFGQEEEPGLYADLETGTVWDVWNGQAVAGPLQGERLRRISAPLVFWFAWSDLHSGTEIFEQR